MGENQVGSQIPMQPNNKQTQYQQPQPRMIQTTSGVLSLAFGIGTIVIILISFTQSSVRGNAEFISKQEAILYGAYFSGLLAVCLGAVNIAKPNGKLGKIGFVCGIIGTVIALIVDTVN